MFQKKINLIITFIITTFLVYSCVDNDVCDEDTTPRLTIAFVDSTSQAQQKDSLYIGVVNTDNTISQYVFASVDSVRIPLNVLSDKTILYLYDSYNTAESSKNIITITYQTEQSFISSACGFKVLYNNVNYDPTRLVDIKKITSNTTQIHEESKNLYITY